MTFLYALFLLWTPLCMNSEEPLSKSHLKIPGALQKKRTLAVTTSSSEKSDEELIVVQKKQESTDAALECVKKQKIPSPSKTPHLGPKNSFTPIDIPPLDLYRHESEGISFTSQNIVHNLALKRIGNSAQVSLPQVHCYIKYTTKQRPDNTSGYSDDTSIEEDSQYTKYTEKAQTSLTDPRELLGRVDTPTGDMLFKKFDNSCCKSDKEEKGSL